MIRVRCLVYELDRCSFNFKNIFSFSWYFFLLTIINFWRRCLVVFWFPYWFYVILIYLLWISSLNKKDIEFEYFLDYHLLILAKLMNVIHLKSYCVNKSYRQKCWVIHFFFLWDFHWFFRIKAPFSKAITQKS